MAFFFYFCFNFLKNNFFLAHCRAYGILVPQPEMEPKSPAVEGQSLNHWTTREVPRMCKHTVLKCLPSLWSRPPGSSVSKESACSAGDLGWIPESGRSLGERNGNPLQYSCLENPMDRRAWRATVRRVKTSQTWLSSQAQSNPKEPKIYILYAIHIKKYKTEMCF